MNVIPYRTIALLLLICTIISVVSGGTIIIYTTGEGDGVMYNGFQNLSLADIRAMTSSTVAKTDVTTFSRLDSHASFNPNFRGIHRTYLEFNLSALQTACAAGCTIDSAQVGLMGHATTYENLGATTFGLTRFKPATNGTAVSGDFDSFDNEYLSDTKIASNVWSTSAYNNFTLNSLGLSNISSLPPYANYMFRIRWDIENVNTGLIWGAASYTSLTLQNDEHGTTGDPFLEVVYTPAAGGDTTPPASISGLANTTTCNSINFTWTNPGGDQNETVIWKDNALWKNVSNTTTFEEFTGLNGWKSYTFSSKTKDIAGNLNETWINMTAQTSPICIIEGILRNWFWRLPTEMMR